MKKILFVIFCLSVGVNFEANAKKPKQKIIYKYKKYEKFDFEDLIIEGETGNPGDLSIAPRYQRRFKVSFAFN